MEELIGEDEFHAIRRHGRFIVVRLLVPHQVLSTSAWGGGQRTGLRYLLNHQSCEGSGHHARMEIVHALGDEGYHRRVCAEAGVVPEETAMMGTAANMNYAAVAVERFAEVCVRAVVTAGVEGNAVRSGDPAAWHEGTDGWGKVNPNAGTINTMLLFNWPLTPAALARAVVTITEAKSAALQELAVSSRYSADLATGTGTDQYCIAAPVDDAKTPKTSTGQHAKLGELIGRAVRLATLEALRWQNGLDPSYTRSLTHALRRFGLSQEGLEAALAERLDDPAFLLFKKNIRSVLYEPQLAAAAYAFAAVWDRVRHGTLPASVARTVLRQQAALMATALAATPAQWGACFAALEVDMAAPLAAVYDALALGWRNKWR